jgi:hypothetical protein
MATTTNPNSVLYQLRALMPKRPLTQFEAYRLAELQANHLLRAAGIATPGTEPIKRCIYPYKPTDRLTGYFRRSRVLEAA